MYQRCERSTPNGSKYLEISRSVCGTHLHFLPHAKKSEHSSTSHLQIATHIYIYWFSHSFYLYMSQKINFKQPFFIGIYAVVLQLLKKSIFIDFTFTKSTQLDQIEKKME